ncbi:AAA family ATPase (plasmid) [Rothia amarae]|uniref:AAA family ATPase n=1 Tax=Rothia amarae TaxID=169480 RepID=A0A7S6WWL6_9MICC|nr:AAA family ATPase [Rothia amarae]QOW64907.1 AAA family ATPase [Rothia amarae]
MKFSTIRLKNFQSFGPNPTPIDLSSLTFVLGPNGSGKTAVLQALTRLFSPIPNQRSIRFADFHVAQELTDNGHQKKAEELWIEVEIEFPEAEEENPHASTSAFFSHMRLEEEGSIPKCRVRLTATINAFEEIEERIEYVLSYNSEGKPEDVQPMSRYDRGSIEVFYLPARRDPGDHISYAASSLLGRTLRAANWIAESEKLEALNEEISTTLAENKAVIEFSDNLRIQWEKVHAGSYLKNPEIVFGHNRIEGVLRQLSIQFSPSHQANALPSENLSDGQKSLLYISLALAWQKLCRGVLAGEEIGLDPDKLRPPVHIIFALEEPENSLSPQYLGRIIRQLRDACDEGDVQALIATHASTLLRRVDPADIRFLRLNHARETTVRRIILPTEDTEAAKYVREAVMAFPELYFSRLVVLGEGASELVVLPRVLEAAGIREDDTSVSVVPLGGRHVNHFWRLLENLEIPYVTLLDLDSARHGGGWGRIHTAMRNINKYRPEFYSQNHFDFLPPAGYEESIPVFGQSPDVLKRLENSNEVFFSSPLDLDLMMMKAFPCAYQVRLRNPRDTTVTSVLGKSHRNEVLLGKDNLKLLEDYREKFGQKSKPASHLQALAQLNDNDLLENLPPVLIRLADVVREKLAELPE